MCKSWKERDSTTLKIKTFEASLMVVRFLSSLRGTGSIPGQAAKTPHASGPKKQHKTQNRSSVVTNTIDLKKKKEI